jgi:bifunctional DNA-binding transcriptional regulator/antitoxin component of YhaV-PrlF toxin-antitoxin module
LTKIAHAFYPESESGESGSPDVLLSMTVTLDNKPIVVPDAIRRKAGLRRGERVEFKVSGRAITIVPKESAESDYPMETVMRIIKEAKEHPMSRRQGAALDASLMAYGAKQAKKVGIKERDIPRVIHESRARRRTA